MKDSLILDASSIYLLIKRKEFEPIRDSKTLDLAYYELGNAVLGELRRKIISPETYRYLGKIVQTVLEIITLVDFNQLETGRISQICESSKLTFYDAAYLALAETQRDSLTTNDLLLGKEAVKRGIKTFSVPESE